MTFASCGTWRPVGAASPVRGRGGRRYSTMDRVETMRSTVFFVVFLAASVAAFGSWRSILHRRRASDRVVLDGVIRESATPVQAASGHFGIVLPAESAAIEPYVVGRIQRIFVKPGDGVP